MKSFQQAAVVLFALCASALAQESVAYDATVYVTSTVYRVNTVTLSGSPSSSVANETSTISATIPSYVPSYPVNSTTVYPTAVYPTGTGAPSSPSGSASPSSTTSPEFPGAASQLTINAFVAAVAVGVGYLAL
ncbi:hypothetical protein P154DRAFT_346641 [Amniculicola lignicola CBS 123094]|uniref:Uncharacterized protein n=1 Tax=Amniculicola lignicola CBS 123094 TaxID=1392246 RepID=A0A6A5W2T2_9PLEO|nr:hypothetical protein P154DRAFT_346641 [Amniculicola lignicola CBS 123094]